MGTFDRYFLTQILGFFGFISLILVLIYWINRAVKLLDYLIANGHSALVFLEFTALSLPGVIGIVLPMSCVAATIYATNKLASESELVVVQSTGYSPYRMSRPVLLFGVLVALLISILTHVLIPASITQLNERRAEIAENVTARLLTEGTFLHPAESVTFYIRRITPEGELRDVFLADGRSERFRTTYSASRALLIRSDTGPKLVMFDGMAQSLNLEEMRLATTSFGDFSFDIGGLIDVLPPGQRTYREVGTTELFAASPELQTETGQSAGFLARAAHERISQAILPLSAALLAFATLMVGGFSRFGLWRQILGAVMLVILLKTMDNLLLNAAAKSIAHWPLVYVATVLGLIISYVMLWLSGQQARLHRGFSRTPKPEAAA